jgi:hypothetical protein
MQKIATTVLESTYKPDTFFEEKLDINLMGGSIVLESGKIRGEFPGELYDEGRDFRDKVQTFIARIFVSQQVKTLKDYSLSNMAMSREYPDGRRDCIGFPETVSATAIDGSSIDFVHKDSNGEIILDTKAERLSDQEEYRKKAAVLLETDEIMKKITGSLSAAISDRKNLFIHLEEIREVLKKEFGGEKETPKALGISAKDWNHFGKLANDDPLAEGRHRGKHLELRNASREEIGWALQFSKVLIEKYTDIKTS